MGIGTFISLLKTIYYFIVEIIFDSNEEKSFSSDKFNTRKWVMAGIFTFSLVLNFYLGHKLADLTEIAIDVRKHEQKMIKEIKDNCGISLKPYKFNKK